MADGDLAYKAPGSGKPLDPQDIVSPSADTIAAAVVQKLVVPHPVMRTAVLSLGLSGVGSKQVLSANALNAVISQPMLPASGIIVSMDFNAAIVSTGAAAGVLQLFDGTGTLLRTYPVSVGAAGTFSLVYSSTPERLPFINGLTALWTPLTAAFGASIININADYMVIPIGQKTTDNNYV